MILKKLALSENNILEIKREINIKKAFEKSQKMKKCIIIKLILFFFLGLIFMLFFCFFISCFCAVYINTQKILIENTFISFMLSMIYPFGLCLFPGFLRIPALKAKNKDKECLYKVSLIISYLI